MPYSLNGHITLNTSQCGPCQESIRTSSTELSDDTEKCGESPHSSPDKKPLHDLAKYFKKFMRKELDRTVPLPYNVWFEKQKEMKRHPGQFKPGNTEWKKQFPDGDPRASP